MDALFYLIIIALTPIIFPIIIKKTIGWDTKIDLTGHGLTGGQQKASPLISPPLQI